MTKRPTYKDDLIERLSDPAYASRYLNEALEEAMEDGFVGGLMVAIRDVIEAHGGVSKFSKKLKGKSRTSLYKTLAEDGNPEFSTVLQIIKHLPFDLHFNRSSSRKAS